MKKEWRESKYETYQQYVYDWRYIIDVSIFNGINYFVELNDRFKWFKNFLKIEKRSDLESRIKVVEIKFHRYDSEDENIFEKKIYSKTNSLNESSEENFCVFDLSADGNSVLWGKFLSEEIEDYVNLCKKQVELWEE